MKDKTIIILARKVKSTNIVYNSLKNDFPVTKVILEEPAKIQFLKRRIKRLGFGKVFGQILFKLLIVPFLKIAAKKRVQEIKKSFSLNDQPIDKSKIMNVPSVNSERTIRTLQKINPDVVIVNGTRIISDKVLSCIPAKFINIHAGITPQYRGVHGAYWALVENNQDACGVTVHFVDPGIDTGTILEQGIISPKKEDNFVTYPLLQLGVGIPLLKKAIRDFFEDRIEIKSYPKQQSKLWTHPTMLEYLRYKKQCGVK